MAKKSIIQVNKNAPTIIDFELAVEGVENGSTKAMLVIENVISGCDVSIAAKHTDGKWSVTIPNLKNFKESEYNVRLDVIVDGYYFTPSAGKMKLVDEPIVEVVTAEASETVVEESLEQAREDMPETIGPDTSEEGAELAGRVVSPLSGDAAAIKEPSVGNSKHDIDNARAIKDIASSVNGTQLPFDEDDMKETAKASAHKALTEMMPILKNKPVVSSDKGTLLKPITPKRDMAKDQAVREALGLPARKKSK